MSPIRAHSTVIRLWAIYMNSRVIYTSKHTLTPPVFEDWKMETNDYFFIKFNSLC